MLTRKQLEPDLGEDSLKVFITAAECYPEMERAFLAAKREVWASYRVFDLTTKLRSDEARDVGSTWFDLVVHTLRRGVELNFILSDFDPILGGELHCASWSARRAFIAAGEVAGPEARLNVVNAAHSARVGLLPRLLLWPRLVKEIGKQAEALNAASPQERAREMECRPGLRPWLDGDPDGELTARKWYPPPLIPTTHHQKMAVFDRETLCIGGLDLDERRYDDKGHHRRQDETWHDVQLMCRGTVVEDAQRHLETFLEAIAGKRDPAPPGALLRTQSRRRKFQFPHMGPRPDISELAEAHHYSIARARHLVYLETQFFRDRRIAEALATAALRRPSLGLIMILPGAPEEVAFNDSRSADARYGEYLQADCIKTVREAFGGRAAICSPVRPVAAEDTDGRDTLCGAPIIYVHAKVSIFDADKAIVSSANLNGRSMYWDTEAGVLLDERDAVAMLRRRVCGHWLPGDAPADFLDIRQASRKWRQLAHDNAKREPSDREGFIVPYDARPARRLGWPLPLVPEAMV